MNYIRLSILFIIIIIGYSCKDSNSPYIVIQGETMGTYYSIKLQYHEDKVLKSKIDSILTEFNLSLSTYIQGSTISQFNKADSSFCFNSENDIYFVPVFEKSKEIFNLTDSYFDPSIAPLVNYYGFGYSEKKPVEKTDTFLVMQLMELLVFNELALIHSDETTCIQKSSPRVSLDFSAIAKGYGVDILAAFLDDLGITNYMVEIGGEVSTKGLNDKGSPWVIGINKPKENSSLTAIEVPLQISNKSLATSGNYRNNYEASGHKFAHIINPKTGMSYQTDILSVTVVADDCMTADAFATAFMTMGLEKSLTLANNLNNIDALFIFDIEGDGQFEYRSTDNFSKYYLDNEQK